MSVSCRVPVHTRATNMAQCHFKGSQNTEGLYVCLLLCPDAGGIVGLQARHSGSPTYHPAYSPAQGVRPSVSVTVAVSHHVCPVGRLSDTWRGRAGHCRDLGHVSSKLRPAGTVVHAAVESVRQAGSSVFRRRKWGADVRVPLRPLTLPARDLLSGASSPCFSDAWATCLLLLSPDAPPVCSSLSPGAEGESLLFPLNRLSSGCQHPDPGAHLKTPPSSVLWPRQGCSGSSRGQFS